MGCWVQVWPPSTVPNAAKLPLESWPTASHRCGRGQLTPTMNIDPGIGCVVQVTPPSVVPKSFVGPRPTASQTRAVGQATPTRSVKPAGIWRRFQVCPPVDVVATTPTSLLPASTAFCPTETQTRTVGQATPLRSCTDGGRVWADQVRPPLTVRSAIPLLPKPTASHVVVVGQDTPCTRVALAGVACRVQVIPPLMVPNMAPVFPVTSQTVPDGQATAMNSPPASTAGCACHVLPPLRVPYTAPASPLPSPTTSQ